ncbi:MAG TPA: type II secretion system F family protein [Methanomicrobiales archaeon]|nr:type II secretion system F family protein [Methanomicrobiales archaeon]
MGFQEILDNFLNRSRYHPADAPGYVLDDFERSQADITEKIAYQKKIQEGFLKFVKHPLAFIKEHPTNILYITVPVALFVFAAGLLLIINNYGIISLFEDTMIDDFMVWAVLIAIVPLAAFQYLEDKRVYSLEESLPNFFRDVAGMNDSGMTLPNAIANVAQGEYGALTVYIRRLAAEMSWSVPFVDALYRFGQRVGTPLAARSVDLVGKASRAGGDVSEVLRAAANDTYEFFNLKNERKNNMLIYMVIVLVSFFVFLFVIAILESTFLTTMAEAGSKVASTGAKGFMSKVNIAFYKRLFSHAAMIQGFFSGLVAGQMGEGDAIAGLKYSAIMLLIAWLTFRFFI